MRKQPAHTSSLPPLCCSAQSRLWMQGGRVLSWGGFHPGEGGFYPGEGIIQGRGSSCCFLAWLISQAGADLPFFFFLFFFKPSNNSLLTHIIVTINNNNNIMCSYHQITASIVISMELQRYFQISTLILFISLI